MNSSAPEPKRVLQLFSREAQELWKDTTPLQRLEWLDFAIYAAWAGAAHNVKMDTRQGYSGMTDGKA